MHSKDRSLVCDIPFDGEFLGRYERRGIRLTRELALDMHTFLSHLDHEMPTVKLQEGILRYDIDSNRPARSSGRVHFRPGRGPFYIYEIPSNADNTCKHGILLESANSEPSRMRLRDFYALLTLKSLVSLPSQSLRPAIDTQHLAMATQIATLFEQELLLSTCNRQGWNHTGSQAFVDKAAFWIQQQVPVRMALPAFPCKTTNRDKAAASVPDGGEFEALAKLSIFCQHVQKIYDPGCQLYIVSDGHVFSDCIGADDGTVTTYSRKLKEMLKEVYHHHPVPKGGIEFFNLETLLQLDSATHRKLLG